MSYPVTEFTPVMSAAGGALIGLSAVLLMAFLGRIAGISGIVGGLLPKIGEPDKDWRLAFVLGAIVAPVLLTLARVEFPPLTVMAGPAALIASGVIVGIGVTFGSGCTSGHGVCGNARLSGRSMVATLTFMATAAATVFVIRHVIGG